MSAMTTFIPAAVEGLRHAEAHAAATTGNESRFARNVSHAALPSPAQAFACSSSVQRVAAASRAQRMRCALACSLAAHRIQLPPRAAPAARAAAPLTAIIQVRILARLSSSRSESLLTSMSLCAKSRARTPPPSRRSANMASPRCTKHRAAPACSPPTCARSTPARSCRARGYGSRAAGRQLDDPRRRRGVSSPATFWSLRRPPPARTAISAICSPPRCRRTA